MGLRSILGTSLALAFLGWIVKNETMLCNLRNSIYQDRRNKAALCYDFPADRVLIEGLERMQQHFLNRGSSIEIPVVRVMNTAHFLATCMLNTPFAEQGDYDRMIDHDIRERVLVPIVLIALVAMLKRTDGKRARECRAVLMENRSEDFYEGVSLYEQWLSGAIERYDEEAFYIDVMDEINSLREQTEQLIKENVELKIKIKNMSKEERPIIGYNVENMTINMSGGTLVQHADLVQASGEVVVEKTAAISSPAEACAVSSMIFTAKARQRQQSIVDALRQSYIGRRDKAQALVQELNRWANDGYIDSNYNARVMYDELSKIIPLPFGYDGFRKYYNQ